MNYFLIYSHMLPWIVPFYSHFHVRIYSYFSCDTLVRISSLIKRERNKLHLVTYSSIHSLIHHHSITFFFFFTEGNRLNLTQFHYPILPYSLHHYFIFTRHLARFVFFHSISPLFFVTVQRTIKLKVVKCEF